MAFGRRQGRRVGSLPSLWEVAIKSSLQRADFALDMPELADTSTREGFELLPVRLAPRQVVHR